MVFLITQMHGVPFKRWHKLAITAICLSGAVAFYALNADMISRLPRIFLTRYGAVFVLVGLIWLIMRPFIWSGKKFA